MSVEPVGLILAPAGTSKGVVGGAQYCYKHLSLTHLASIRINDCHGRTTVIDKQLLTRSMQLTHAALLLALPFHIAVAKLRVTVAVIGILLPVFLPQQVLGNTFALQFLMDSRIIRLSKAALPGQWLSREQ